MDKTSFLRCLYFCSQSGRMYFAIFLTRNRCRVSRCRCHVLLSLHLSCFFFFRFFYQNHRGYADFIDQRSEHQNLSLNSGYFRLSTLAFHTFFLVSCNNLYIIISICDLSLSYPSIQASFLRIPFLRMALSSTYDTISAP